MGMSIDLAMNNLSGILTEATEDDNSVCYVTEDDAETLQVAIDTMRKYQMFQAKYVERLKADMVAILTDIQLEIEGLEVPLLYLAEDYEGGVLDCKKIIQQKIDALKGDQAAG